MAAPRGARAPMSAAATLVEAAVRGAVLGGAPRRTVAAVARSAVSAALFAERAEAPAPPPRDAAAGVAPDVPTGPVPDAGAAADPRPAARAAKRRRRRQRRAARKEAGAGAHAEPGAHGMEVELGDEFNEFNDEWADAARRPAAAAAAAPKAPVAPAGAEAAGPKLAEMSEAVAAACVRALADLPDAEPATIEKALEAEFRASGIGIGSDAAGCGGRPLR
ncbi:unnamed protein product [Prorocentrum cordatum]|uniref:Uncharacterized protein n=1 Tax=Prorocentrum cordatum TaxID=2364126 RepID=A0ABN9W4X2_9DINO|nr:unnamed protein product [Polarella glacialis]